MKRSFAMFIIVIGIIVVGVSVTRATKRFVSADGTETAAIEGIADSSEKETIEGRESAEESEEPAGIGRSRSIPDDPEKEETFLEESVKSPLDPAVESVEAYRLEAEETVLTAEDFRKRFAEAEEASETFGKNKGMDSGTDQAAAEQEYVLWDYELNFVYGAIREHLTKDEADELKALELEWMRERDLYADKVLAANKGISAKSAEYLKRMTEKTKERCYWLLDQYGSVLEPENLREKEEK